MIKLVTKSGVSGGLSETPLHGGLVGPTFACVIGIQFRNLRKCDRFWYESGNPLIRFTESQLAEVRKITLAKVMYCHLTPNFPLASLVMGAQQLIIQSPPGRINFCHYVRTSSPYSCR